MPKKIRCRRCGAELPELPDAKHGDTRTIACPKCGVELLLKFAELRDPDGGTDRVVSKGWVVVGRADGEPFEFG